MCGKAIRTGTDNRIVSYFFYIFYSENRFKPSVLREHVMPKHAKQCFHLTLGAVLGQNGPGPLMFQDQMA